MPCASKGDDANGPDFVNVLARAILQDDGERSPRAAKAIEKLARSEGVFIAVSVVLELAWVLRKRKNSVEIYEILHHLLESDGITIGDAAVVGEALEIFRASKIEFGDALLLAESQANGVASVLTFDEILIKSDKTAMRIL